MEPIVAALAAAFNSLIEHASPERQEAILRRALLQVLGDHDEHPASRLLASRSPSISAIDSDDWAALKPQIRAELDLAGMSLADLARDAGVPLSTVQKTLSPHGLTPGRLIADKLAAWLDTRAAEIPDGEGKHVDA
ncbi:MAG TPA: hypothetical protein VNV39_01775 [Stellaceae bacterium]|jgi:lambda repressor-like predicted transcriptional regulator|nr:hypothetical protein [Stellaceae bacterium]